MFALVVTIPTFYPQSLVPAGKHCRTAAACARRNSHLGYHAAVAAPQPQVVDDPHVSGADVYTTNTGASGVGAGTRSTAREPLEVPTFEEGTLRTAATAGAHLAWRRRPHHKSGTM